MGKSPKRSSKKEVQARSQTKAVKEHTSPAEPPAPSIPDSFESPESSTIARGTYNVTGEQLTIEFKTGKRYLYAPFTPEQWVEFMQAESKGHHFNKVIRPMYAGVQV